MEHTFAVPLISVYKMRVERVDSNKCAEHTINQTASATISSLIERLVSQ
jgi:hypothetical protein